ncbi:ribosomal RNA small subunit methyltransferase B [Nitzschia inconspicua]|uniref:Ribosomal RNA small subunit methyltransferase B n=1 Tax=Nitzschia inconspicua TaxID=303405 RepID=A0A9K3KP52_9STRA|nr:ribosomal RNA small subunit methyltransferase B [Nitzschia inconspicua]
MPYQWRKCSFCFRGRLILLLLSAILLDVPLVPSSEALSTRPSGTKGPSTRSTAPNGKNPKNLIQSTATISATPRAAASFALMEAMAPLKKNQKPKIALRQLERNQAFLEMDTRDRAFARMLLSTAERRHGQIEKVLQKYLHQPMSKDRISEVFCQAVLRIGATQLLFMDNIPKYAAIKETVEVLRKHPTIKISQPKINFVNAVLRGLNEDGTEILETTTSVLDNVHPWLAREWIESYGESTTRTMVEAAMEESPIFVSANQLYRDCDDDKEENVAEIIQRAFLVGEPSVDDAKNTPELLPIGCVRIPPTVGGTVSKWPLYQEGAWWVQNPSATLPALALRSGLQQEMSSDQPIYECHVVDLCSAPGGKTAQLCSMGFQNIDAVELSRTRTKPLQENLKRLGMQEKCNVHIEDGRLWFPDLGRNSVDGVLLDAPCSATGLGSRHPDVLTKSLDGGLLEELLVTQKELIAHTVDCILKPGGIMVYATCSLLQQEGEHQMERLLEKRGGIGVEILPFMPVELPGFDDCITEEGWLRVLPGVLKGSLQFCDGFFVARLRKV